MDSDETLHLDGGGGGGAPDGDSSVPFQVDDYIEAAVYFFKDIFKTFCNQNGDEISKDICFEYDAMNQHDLKEFALKRLARSATVRSAFFNKVLSKIATDAQIRQVEQRILQGVDSIHNENVMDILESLEGVHRLDDNDEFYPDKEDEEFYQAMEFAIDSFVYFCDTCNNNNNVECEALCNTFYAIHDYEVIPFVMETLENSNVFRRYFVQELLEHASNDQLKEDMERLLQEDGIHVDKQDIRDYLESLYSEQEEVPVVVSHDTAGERDFKRNKRRYRETEHDAVGEQDSLLEAMASTLAFVGILIMVAFGWNRYTRSRRVSKKNIRQSTGFKKLQEQQRQEEEATEAAKPAKQEGSNKSSNKKKKLQNLTPLRKEPSKKTKSKRRGNDSSKKAAKIQRERASNPSDEKQSATLDTSSRAPNVANRASLEVEQVMETAHSNSTRDESSAKSPAKQVVIVPEEMPVEPSVEEEDRPTVQETEVGLGLTSHENNSSGEKDIVNAMLKPSPPGEESSRPNGSVASREKPERRKWSEVAAKSQAVDPQSVTPLPTNTCTIPITPCCDIMQDFLNEQCDCIKGSPELFYEWLVSEDIYTMENLVEAVSDDDYYKILQQGNGTVGVKGYKQDVFKQAVMTATSLNENERNEPNCFLNFDDSDIPDELICPISHVLMTEDPVLAADGHTYERAFIEEWIRKQQTEVATAKQQLAQGNDSEKARAIIDRGVLSPLTHMKMPYLSLIPNHAVRSLAREKGNGSI